MAEKEKMKLNVKRFSELRTEELYEILRAREEIFTHEKGMVCRDIDGADYNSLHIFLTEDGELIAYLRAIELDVGNVKIGRVLTLTHGMGHGRILMTGAISALQDKLSAKKITVHAQYDAIPFYEKMGFSKISSEYLEEGVWHVTMEINL